jgi:hypothetical protein
MNRAWPRALSRVVRTNATVLDLGGDLGQRAVLACRAGARQVFTLHGAPSTAVVMELATVNGCADRVVCIDDLSAVPSDAAIDVVLGRWPGDLPLYGTSLAAYQRERQRPMGAAPSRFVPVSEELWAAPVEAPELHARHLYPWDRAAYGIDLSAAETMAVNTWSRFQTGGRALAPAVRGVTVTYAAAVPSDLRFDLHWTLGTAGLCHGIALWPEVTLCAQVMLPNEWDAADACAGRAFFPWPRALKVEPDDRLHCEIRASAIGLSDTWSWTSSLVRADREVARFAQSTFLGSLDVAHVPGR